jgi:hypothetical protein
VVSKLILSLTLLCISTSVFATKTCTGEVSGVSVSASGMVVATIKSSEINLSDIGFCNLEKQDGGYSPESCKGVLSLLTAGQAMKSTATIWVGDDSFTCFSSWKDLSNHSFYHIKLN